MIFLKLFLTFFKIGAFTFGGGYAMLPMIQQEVLNNKWMDIQDITDFVAISESSPGPFAINVSTFVGFKMGGVLGAFAATLGIVLPSFIIIMIVAKAFERFQKSKLVKGAMTGLRPAVVGLIATAIMTTGRATFAVADVTSILSVELVCQVVIMIGALVALFKKVNPIFVIIGSAALGIIVNVVI